MKKKITLICILLIFCAATFTACGSDPMIVQETKTGLNLEDKARELTGQQGDEADENEKNLEHTPE
ncbi:MAG: hypothetical protein J5517_02180 [Eubacterium sp.]|nr:hypothetical protein [Eubacterium sp.]